jgi:hypothetical protein
MNLKLIVGIVIVIIIVVFFTYKFIPKPCPDIIPERIPLKGDKGDGRLGYTTTTTPFGFSTGISTNIWKDGTRINPFICEKGKNPGENINYYYCYGLDYYNKSISKTGQIEREIRLRVDLVIDPKDTNSEGYKIIKATCK